MPPPQKNKRKHPDWDAFFGNGVPREIITIADDSPPPSTSNKIAKTSAYTDAQPTVAGASAGHIDKRRRVDPAARYEPSYQSSTTVNRQRPWEEDSDLSHSASRGRSSATNAYSTGQTSLSASSGSQQRVRLDNTQAGQKRKRVQDRSPDGSSDVEIVKRTIVQDQWGEYVPPARPPIKAKEIYVKPVTEVSLNDLLSTLHSADIFTATRWHQV